MRQWFYNFLFFLPVAMSPALSQETGCSGSLGENIFEAGDFGSGMLNIVQDDPGIAPGYTYTTTPPPADGFYLLTNNMALWNNIYGDWRGYSDNSNDPNGYMMVVNADYSPGLFYEQTVEGLCENTTYEFSADILNLDRAGLVGRIRPNVSFLINGEVVYSTGDIINDEQWHSYGFTMTTSPDENSVVLSLTNNAPGGLGNDLALDNIAFRACGVSAFLENGFPETVCEGGVPVLMEANIGGDPESSYYIQWQISRNDGVDWEDIEGENELSLNFNPEEPGVFLIRYLIASSEITIENPKCRVVSAIKELEVTPKFRTTADTICEGGKYVQGSSGYTTTGVYTDTVINNMGCVNILTVNLIVLPDPQIESTIAVTDPSCYDFADAALVIEEVIGGYAPITTLLIKEPNDTLNNLSALSAGEYRIRVLDRFGCFDETSFELINPDPFVIDLGSDRRVSLGESVRVEISSNESILQTNWSPAEVCDSACLDVEFVPLEDMTLVASAVSVMNCPAIDSIQIIVDENIQIYAPSAFSPNDDGINDRYYLLGSKEAVSEVEELSIFNRWGQRVFYLKHPELNRVEDGWDGTIDGKRAGAGTYVFLARIRLINDVVIEKTGDLLLID